MQTSKLKVKDRVHVVCRIPFNGVITAKFTMENMFNKEVSYKYHVKADDDGHTYEVFSDSKETTINKI